MPIQIAGNVRYGGLYETACGLMLGEIVYGLDARRAGSPCGGSQDLCQTMKFGSLWAVAEFAP
jgi:NADH:ubiquinone oxidoreductase subunit F (NADH-binding)